MFVAGRCRGLRIGLVATGVAVLTACGGGGSAPRSLPPLSTTPAAVTSTAPPTTKAADLAAVKAVVRRYYRLLNGLRQRMDADALQELMTQECACRAQVDAIHAASKKGQRYIDHVQLVSLTPALETHDRADVLVQFNAAAGGLVDSSGRRVTFAPAEKAVKRFFVLKRTGARWLISEIRPA